MKTIGLIDADYKRGTNLFNKPSLFPNLALMKISAYYKQKDYRVEWYKPIMHHSYHKIFVSKVFDWESPINPYLRKDMIMGGSGIDLYKDLPDKIEHICPDYDLYGIDYALGFITRGCIRKCPFCIVWKKEGMIKKHSNIEEFWKNQNKIKLLDNNFLAYKDHLEELKKLIEINVKVDFNQGLDIRLINDENAELLSTLKKWDNTDLRFAFDDPKMKEIIKEKTEILRNHGITRGYFYVLIGYNTTPKEDSERISLLNELGHRIYIMPYNKKKLYQKAMRKYINRFFYRKMNFEVFIKEYGSHEMKMKLITKQTI